MDGLIEIIIVCVILAWVYRRVKDLFEDIKLERDAGDMIVNGKEFQTKLEEAKRLKGELQNAVNSNDHGGSVMVLLYNIDHREKNDYGNDYNIYFRVHFDYIPWAYIERIRKLHRTDEARLRLTDALLLQMLGKTIQQAEEMGIDPNDFVFEMERMDDEEYGGVLYIPFRCPYSMKGDKRKLFLDKI